MKYEYPEWATEKQIEGMNEFLAAANEYGHFDVEFIQTDYDYGSHRFYAVVSWESSGYGLGRREHRFDIAWYYEKTWNIAGEESKPYWQFLFAGGDAIREISTEVFLVDLFYYLDNFAVTQECTTGK